VEEDRSSAIIEMVVDDGGLHLAALRSSLVACA
jgi:hypothetical protein